MDDEAREIARKIDGATRADILRLGPDFSRLGVPRGKGRVVAARLRGLPGLCEWEWAGDSHRYRLTPLGLAVREHLQKGSA